MEGTMAEKAIKTAVRFDGCRVCPWQYIKYADNFLRPLIHNPSRLFGPYVRPGMTVLDVGCGRGFASLGLARLVGEGGTVIAADVQPQMLEMVEARAREAGLSARIRTHLVRPDRIGVRGPVDFAVAFWMVHEVPDRERFISEVSSILAPGGHFFVVEPPVHTTKRDFELLLGWAAAAGLVPVGRPRVFFGRAVVLKKATQVRERRNG
jgi:SAM-dependent methyltransferase